EGANQLAWEVGFMERERKLTGASFVKGLVFGWISDPQMSLAGLSQSIGNAGTPITRQGLQDRFTPQASWFLRAVLEKCLAVMVEANPVPTKLLQRFKRVYLVDSTIVTLPDTLSEVWQGSGGSEGASNAALKVSVKLDMLKGCLETLDLTDARQHDSQSIAHQEPMEAGSLRIEDLGYFSLDALEQVGLMGSYWLTRYKHGTYICDEQGHLVDLENWLPQQVGQTIDHEIRLGKSKQLPCRLVAERVPAAVVQQRRQRLEEEARHRQQSVSQKAWALAHWTIYITNVPPIMVTVEAVLALGRLRWQIELLFKLWKSDLQIDKWRSQNPDRILCELYAKLIGAIVTHWLLLVSCWANPQRSLRQAIPTIRGLAWQFANSIARPILLRHAFMALERALSCCQMERSQVRPRAFQLLATYTA
ncbi:MAG: IS4 family transposase, partial [Phycisphaerae bacterium]|nr:IS4 family transposase [Phycisphaerae bacterium]